MSSCHDRADLKLVRFSCTILFISYNNLKLVRVIVDLRPDSTSSLDHSPAWIELNPGIATTLRPHAISMTGSLNWKRTLLYV